MNLKQFLDKWTGKVIDYDGYYGYQCKDYTNQYTKEVFGIESPKGNAFEVYFADWGDEFEKIKNYPEFLPEPGDIVIFNVGTWGHIGIVVSATLNTLMVSDQNTGSGNGDGVGDNKIRTHQYNYDNVYGFIRYKKMKTEQDLRKEFNIPALFRGVDIKISMEEKPGKPNVNASYDWENNYMILYPRFFTHDEFKRKLILEHEFAHYIHIEIVHRFHKDVFEYWKELSLKSNAFVTNHARKNYFEDFAENIEEYIKQPTKVYGNDIDEKIRVAVAIMRRYAIGWDY